MNREEFFSNFNVIASQVTKKMVTKERTKYLLYVVLSQIINEQSIASFTSILALIRVSIFLRQTLTLIFV